MEAFCPGQSPPIATYLHFPRGDRKGADLAVGGHNERSAPILWRDTLGPFALQGWIIDFTDRTPSAQFSSGSNAGSTPKLRRQHIETLAYHEFLKKLWWLKR